MTRALVVYESMWGNSERVARAVAEGVGEVMPVDLTDVAVAPVDLDGVSLVVAGGPTHGLSMSSTKSRRDAREHGALHGSIGVGLREWLDELPDEHDRWLAAFDTRVAASLHLPASAARAAAREGRRHRFLRAARPKSFYVHDLDGPLLEGELERALAWGREVAASLPAPGQNGKPRHALRMTATAAAHDAGADDATRPDIVAAPRAAPLATASATPPAPPEVADVPEPASRPDPPPRIGERTTEYDPPLETLLERVLALRARVGTGRPVVVGVAGEPGAGKSTLTASLVAALRENDTTAVLVPMDGFHLANVALAELGRADRKGAIDTFDGAGYTALLARLRGAGPDTVWAPTYDRSIEESVANAIGVPPGTQVVVTEGNYLLVDDGPWSAVRWLLDEAWAVEVDPKVRRTRLVARHVEFGKPLEVAAAWVGSVDEPNAAFVRATFHRADLVIRGT
jgi:pantothenate kinase